MTKMLKNLINTVKNMKDTSLLMLVMALTIIGGAFWWWNSSASSYLDNISRYEELVEQLQGADEKTETLTLAKESDDVQYLYAVAKSDTNRGRAELKTEKSITLFQVVVSTALTVTVVFALVFIFACWYQEAKRIEEENRKETVHRHERRLNSFRVL